MSHYSDRLERYYRDGDLLSVPEVVEVISTNSDRIVSDRALSDIARLHNLRRERPSPRAVLYHYEDIKNIVVASKRGRHTLTNPSSNALRQRAFKARRRAAGGDSPSGEK